MAILPVGSLLKKTLAELKEYQLGKIKPIRTGKELVDSIFGGLLPGDILTIAGSSGSGKSFDAQRVRNFIMNTENNPEADEYIWVDNSLEMKLLATTIRDIKLKTGKSNKKILTEEFTAEEITLVNDYYKSMSDGRFYIDEEIKDPIAFERETDEFLALHTDKKAVFIGIDHIALMRSVSGAKKDAVDGTVEAINRLKKKYSNSYWIILSQLNRGIEGRSNDKDINAMPNRSDLYQSDVIYQVSNYVYVSHNPFKMGIRAFSRFNVARYEGMEEHFCEEKNGKASFQTLGKIFYIVLKVREGGAFYRDVYIEDIEMSEEEKERYKLEDSSKIEDIQTPIFGKQQDSIPEFKPIKTFGKAEFNDTAEDEKPF